MAVGKKFPSRVCRKIEQFSRSGEDADEESEAEDDKQLIKLTDKGEGTEEDDDEEDVISLIDEQEDDDEETPQSILRIPLYLCLRMNFLFINKSLSCSTTIDVICKPFIHITPYIISHQYSGFDHQFPN